MTTLSALDGLATAERKISAEAHLRRNLGITDSARERVRTKLADVEIEDSPIKHRDHLPRGRRDEQLLSKIRGVSPTSSISSNDSMSISGRQTLLGGGGARLFPRHTKRESASSAISHAFPNEYSIPTIPIPPSPSQSNTLPPPPESPSRFRRRTPTNDSATGKSAHREISVRFDLPPESDDEAHISPVTRDRITGTHSYPLTSTPKVAGVQQLLDAEADSFDSAKSFISAYNTPSSPKATPGRFRRESPSKLLRTLSRATSVTPASIAQSTDSIDDFQTPARIGRSSNPLDEEDEEEIDEAEQTLDLIIASTEDARRRAQRIIKSSREDTEEVLVEMSEEVERVPEVSVWSEKSFFRRIAKKVPGGWAFTPQPKFGRTIEMAEEDEDKDEEIQDPIIRKETAEAGAKWWEFWRTKRKEQEETPPKPPDPPQSHPPPSPPTTSQPQVHKLSSPSHPIRLPRDSSPIRPKPPLSTLTEKRLRLARSLSLLQSDIRQAREGIETLESRLDRISQASRLRTETTDRAVVDRRARGDPPPVVHFPRPAPAVVPGGTYVWFPFSRGWVVGLLWVVLVVQACVIVGGRLERRGVEIWEPYYFAEWSRGEKWPT